MYKLKEFIRGELCGWTKSEIIWIIISVVTIITLSIYGGDNLMGIISATAGVMYVLCAGKGKLSAYAFGLVNCLLYAIISYKAKLYGETMLNVIYYIPMQFVGFYTWSRHMNKATASVEKKRMDVNKRVILTLGILLCTVIYGFILAYLKDSMPYVDSFTTVASVFAMIISVKMFVEQWYIWTAVNVVSVIMWAVTYVNGNDSIATLIMWVIYLISGVIMCIKWEREVRKSKIN